MLEVEGNNNCQPLAPSSYQLYDESILLPGSMNGVEMCSEHLSESSLVGGCLDEPNPSLSNFAEGDAMHEAMPWIDDNITAAYYHAAKHCPEVVQSESPPSRYLEFHAGNVWEAAYRLASYWTSRLEVFGPVAAFLPLSDALTSRDREFLSTVVVPMVPNQSGGGRSAMFLDRCLCSRSEGIDSASKRAIFYIFQCFADLAAATNTAFEAVFVPRLNLGGHRSALPSENVALIKLLINNILCIRIVSVHLVVATKDAGIIAQVMKWVAPVAFQRIGKVFGFQPYVHTGSTDAVLAELRQHGFEKSSIPQRFGGDWSQKRPDWGEIDRVRLDARACQTAPGQGRVIRPSNRTPSPMESSVMQEDCSGMDPIPVSALSGSGKNIRFEGDPVHDAMSLINESSAYLQAIEQCPEVIRAESPHHRFLLANGCDPWAAAQKLAQYWSLRLLVFGSQDAFRPLAALIDSQVKDVLKEGYRSALPGKHGNVLFCDHTGRKRSCDLAHELKVMWFHLHLMRESLLADQARKNGGGKDEHTAGVLSFQAIAVVSFSDLLKPRSSELPEMTLFQALTTALGMTIEHIHVVFVSQGAIVQSMLTTAVIGLFRYAASWLTAVPKTMHSGTIAQVEASFQEHGFSSECLPAACGGSWTFESWHAFVDEYFDSLVKLVADHRTENWHRAADMIEAPDECTMRGAGGTQTGSVPVDEPVCEESARSWCLYHVVHAAMTMVEENTDLYMRATEICPQVVWSESNLDHFLSFAHGNASDGAKRLAAYWRLRVDVMGPESAFKPLQTALTPADWEFLKRPFRAILPDDDAGCRVVYMDRIQFDTTLTRSSFLEPRLRSLFWLLSMCSTPACNGDGLVLLLRLNNSRLSVLRNDRDVAEIARRALTGAMCTRIKCVHILSIDPPDKLKPPPLAKLVARLTDRVATWFHGIQVITHTGSKREVVDSLKCHGLPARVIPKQCGGSYSVETQWPAEVDQVRQRSCASAKHPPPLRHEADSDARETKLLGPAVHDRLASMLCARGKGVEPFRNVGRTQPATEPASVDKLSATANGAQPMPKRWLALASDTPKLSSGDESGDNERTASLLSSNAEDLMQSYKDIAHDVDFLMKARRLRRRQRNKLAARRKRARIQKSSEEKGGSIMLEK